MPESKAPTIEFPCHYPIRVMGHAEDDFLDNVLDIVCRHAPDTQRDSVKLRDSRKGRFVSVHVVIYATGVDQLERLHQSLMEYSAVKMVL